MMLFWNYINFLWTPNFHQLLWNKLLYPQYTYFDDDCWTGCFTIRTEYFRCFLCECLNIYNLEASRNFVVVFIFLFFDRTLKFSPIEHPLYKSKIKKFNIFCALSILYLMNLIYYRFPYVTYCMQVICLHIQNLSNHNHSSRMSENNDLHPKLVSFLNSFKKETLQSLCITNIL